MNVISMVLFGHKSRYWLCLPASILSHLELYPGFSLRLYHSLDIRSNPGFDFLGELSRRCQRLELIEAAEPYQQTEPTLWRMRPLWDKTVDTFFSRDVDSVPCSDELRAVRVFMDHPTAAIHSIRSYKLHNTLLMAGLCGFKAPKLKFITDQVPDFGGYLNYAKKLSQNAEGAFGCDQAALKQFFAPAIQFILDSPVGSATPLSDLMIRLPNQCYADVDMGQFNQSLLRICDEVMATPWGEYRGFAGRPQGDFSAQLKQMLALDCALAGVYREIFAARPDLAAFFQAV